MLNKKAEMPSRKRSPSVAEVTTITEEMDGLEVNAALIDRRPSIILDAVALEDDSTLEDPLCTAATAKKITFQDVTTASFLIKGGVEYTPCTVS